VRGAAEDDQPVHFVQLAQLYLAQWAGLLQPAEALLDQPAAAQADLIARMPGGSAIQVRALLTMEVRSVAVIGTVLGAEALLRRPGLDQWAVHGEVIVGQERLGPLVHFGEKALRHLAGEQTVPVLGEHRMVPHRVVHAQADEPAEEKVVVDLLDQPGARSAPRTTPAATAPAEHTPARSKAVPDPNTAHRTRRSTTAAPRRSASESPAKDAPEEPLAPTKHSCTAHPESARLHAYS
jgi:hypothetical protein